MNTNTGLDLFAGVRAHRAVPMRRALLIRIGLLVALLLVNSCKLEPAPGHPAEWAGSPALRERTALPPTLDLRQPMALAAAAIPPRLDPTMNYRPWFLLRGRGGIPTTPEHASWDLGDMTGRYLEGLILARRMGVSSPVLSNAEARLQRFLFSLLGAEGLVHDPQTGAIDHSFSQGSALYGLLAVFEDSGDPAARRAIEALITAQLRRAERHGDQLIDPTVKLEQSCGSHLAGYQIYPVIRFYELTGYADALVLAEGLTRWTMNDPVLGPQGEITKPLSWEGHIHSWLETLAGCARTARNSKALDRPQVLARCRAVYEWVRRTNATTFGWIATYPTGGSSETCAISSAIRLALELAAAGYPEYLDDVERFVRNQVLAAQFKDLDAYTDGTNKPSPLLVGCFDSQSMPNGHLGTRGGEDVGTVEGCCLNGGMRALALAWNAIQSADETGVTVNLNLTRFGPACDVIGYQPHEGGVDVIPRTPGAVRIRVPSWAKPQEVFVLVDGKTVPWEFEGPFAVVKAVRAGQSVSVRYPLRKLAETVVVGGQTFRMSWRGDVVVGADPPGRREPTYRRLGGWAERGDCPAAVPDTYSLEDAARLASMSMLARIDLERGGQPFFRIYPFAKPPRAEHEKWDDGDMSGRYVEALLYSRALTGLPLDPRELLLRKCFAGLFDPTDGLCYTRETEWTPRRACLFSQSSAMLGLLAWFRETGSPEARKLLDHQVDGLMRIARQADNSACFPKYEFDGSAYVDDPPGKDAPIWYGGRLILPLVEYWQISRREDVRVFLEKLIRHCVEVSHFIKPDGEVERGEAWWGHLHGTMDMTTGIAEFGRLTGRAELIAWSKRVYDWIGRTHTTRYGWIADVSGGHICESCGIASRIRLGLSLYWAGAADPFGEMDRHLRNQLLENQFVDVSFMAPLDLTKPRTDRAVYAGVDRMIRGTFQCWGTANDLIGHDDIEGCGAGGGVQALALASNAQAEWRDTAAGAELRIHLLFNRTIRGRTQPPFTLAGPVAAQLWSYLPFEGRVLLVAHQSIPRVALRLPDGADSSQARVRRLTAGTRPGAKDMTGTGLEMEKGYAAVPGIAAGEIVELLFPLKEYETVERAAGVDYHVQWKGSWVFSVSPPGTNAPLYANRQSMMRSPTPLSGPRYPN